MRTDRTDTGGLFVGRRPGTKPTQFRDPPAEPSEGRRRLDTVLAAGVLLALCLGSLLCWGLIPMGCLWLGSRVDYVTGSVSLGMLASIAALFAFLFGTLSLLRRLDASWVLIRRAAGRDQRAGVLGRVFAFASLMGAVGFVLRFFVIHGPGYGSPDLRVP
jgi:hypothetical protein